MSQSADHPASKKCLAALGLLLSAMSLAVPTISLAKLTPSAQRAADSYLYELKRVEQSVGRQSMERLFIRADSLDDYLFGFGGLPSIEELPEAELDSLQAMLRGVKIVISDYVFTYLDDDFFRQLAELKGLPQDQEFLKAYAARDLGSESVQDCTHFGANLLVNQHEAWLRFKGRHPRDYVRIVAKEDEEVIGSLLDTCACGDSSSVDLELRTFLQRFPNDPIFQQVRDRLAALRRGTSGIKFNCPPPHYN